MKKTIVLVVLFVMPIVIYLFFASGVTNFGKLAIVTQNVPDISLLDSSRTFKKKITILGFLGRNVAQRKGNAFNLNQKIYNRFYKFKDFQFVMVVPYGTEDDVKELKDELAQLVDIKKWKFVYGDEAKIKDLFSGLKTNIALDENLGTPYVFIIDKDNNVRGRVNDEDEGKKYGFNTTSVAELNNKMVDDVKIILAEYRLALKKNTSNREK